MRFEVCTCRTMTINSFEGQSVTLPCKYDSRYHGLCDICWMRGSIPANGCGNQIIYATGKKVDMQSNVRYQLNGALQMGDASLTILNAKKTDSGLYGCRVHVPGWFNDKKIEVYLVIMEETQQTTNTLGNVTTTSYNITDGPVITTYRETTKIPEHVTTKERENDPGASSLEDEKPSQELICLCQLQQLGQQRDPTDDKLTQQLNMRFENEYDVTGNSNAKCST
ncbi:hepatitis A virus cellular receptor 1-like precursor [Silurus meridionalis]|nr:hepatitis A virus cellular receptor 1-like precursor [Silurus meridionalis]